MAFVTINAPRYAQDAPASTDLFADIVGDLNYLNTNQNAPGVSGGIPNVVNGSFELDVNATVQPTGWNFVAGTGGSGLVTNVTQNDGAQSYEVIQGTGAGNTGGVLTGPYNGGNQFYAVSPQNAYTLRFMLKCNRSDIANEIVVLWYNSAQGGSIPSTSVLKLLRGSSPTGWTFYSATITPPAGAYFCQLQFNLGTNGTTPPGATGNIFVDGISIIARWPYQNFIALDSNGQTWTVPPGVNEAKIWLVAPNTGISPSGFTIGSYVPLNVFPGDVFTLSFGSGPGFSFVGLQLASQRTGAIYFASGSGMQFQNCVMPANNHPCVILA